MAVWRDNSPIILSPAILGRQSVPDRFPIIITKISNCFLNRVIFDNKEDCEVKEKLTKVGIISSPKSPVLKEGG